MRFAIFANWYDTEYYGSWLYGLALQTDSKFDIITFYINNINRILRKAVKQYDSLMFLDIDDVPMPRLVETVKTLIQEYDVVGCCMRLYGDMTGIFGKDILNDKHYAYGFGNT